MRDDYGKPAPACRTRPLCRRYLTSDNGKYVNFTGRDSTRLAAPWPHNPVCLLRQAVVPRRTSTFQPLPSRPLAAPVRFTTLEHACFPCLLQPLFDIAWIGWHVASVLGGRRIDALHVEALREFTQAKPFAERALIGNGLERLRGERVARWASGSGRGRCLHG